MTTTVYLVAGLLILLLAFGTFRLVRRDYLRHGKLPPLTATLQVAVFALCGCLIQAGYVGTDWPRLHNTGLPFALGVLSTVLGLVILIAAIGVFGLPRMIGRKVDILKQSGVYRWSRNPQLIGGGLVALGFTLLWNMRYVYAIVVVLVYAVIGHMMVLTEEEHLRRVHGEEYERYCERTPRYVGLPGRKP